jgi:tRNA(fMet)-specific endonuclease VapC
MIYLLDTNTVSYIVKGQSRRARRKLARVSVDHDVCISVMTEAEIRFGLARGNLSAATEAAVELFLCKIDILAWDSAAARAYAKARATLERIGKLLANMDLLIAAHAAAVGAVLVTNDHTLEECSKHIDVRHTVNWADDVGVKP